MASTWLATGDDETVSRNALLDGVTTGVFVLKTSFTGDTKQITKTEADTYVNIDTTYPSYAVKTSNQLVTKRNLIPILNCVASVNGTGGDAYPTTRYVVLGSTTGTVTLSYDAQIVPDQFIVRWNGSIVINTGYRGSSDYDFGQPSRGAFQFFLAGKLDPITLTTYPNFTAYPDDGYPRILGPGSGSATFNKSSSTPIDAVVEVYAPISATAWSYSLSCPVTPTTTTTTTAVTVYSFSGSGVSNTSELNACADASTNPKTLYSTCAVLAVGCTLYYDSALTIPVTELYVKSDGSNWDMDGGGLIVALSITQC